MAPYGTLEFFVLFFEQRDALLERLEKELLADTGAFSMLAVALPGIGIVERDHTEEIRSGEKIVTSTDGYNKETLEGKVNES